MNKETFSFLKLTIFSFFTTVMVLISLSAESIVVDRIVATINGEVITLHDLYKAEIPVFGRVILPGEFEIINPDDKARERALLEKIIEDRLLLQRAKELDVSVYPDDVEKFIEQIKSNQNLTEDMFKRALNERGLSFAEYRNRIHAQMIKEKLVFTEVLRKIVITPDEIAEEYEKNKQVFTTPERIKIRHILIPGEENSREIEGAETRANMVASLLKSGSDFQELARLYSRDSSSHKGEISGYISRGDMLPELESAIFELAQGQISPVIKTDTGYHIIKVEQKEEENVKSIEEASPEITTRLNEQKMERRYREWLDELKGQASINILY